MQDEQDRNDAHYQCKLKEKIDVQVRIVLHPRDQKIKQKRNDDDVQPREPHPSTDDFRAFTVGNLFIRIGVCHDCHRVLNQ